MKEYKVSFFSKFVLTDGHTSMTQEEIHSSRLVKLFAYLIINRNMSCSIDKIASAVWGEEQEVNIFGAVKNLMWRLRKMLKSKWPDEQFIVTYSGSYQLNPELNIKADYSEMSRLAAKGRASDDPAEKARLLSSSLDIYKGRFLADYDSEYWIMNIAEHYQNSFVALSKELSYVYRELGEYGEIEKVINMATEAEPLDEELWSILIRTYGEEGKYKKAEQIFHSVSDNLYHTLGIGPSEALKKAYEETISQLRTAEVDIDSVMETLQEENKASGAYYCESGIFKKIYELSMRRLARFGVSIHVGVITIRISSRKRTDPPEGDLLESGMALMKESIIESLRTSDVVARCSRNQFIILLPACKYEMGELVVKRIFKNFDQKKSSGRFSKSFALREMPGMADKSSGDYHGANIGPDAFRVVVNSCDRGGAVEGYIAGVAVDKPVRFRSASQFVSGINNLLDKIGRPQQNTVTRRFSGDSDGRSANWQYSPVIYHPADEIEKLTGKYMTFDIRFTGRNNSTWQGRIFAENGEKAEFTSELDLLHKVEKIFDGI